MSACGEVLQGNGKTKVFGASPYTDYSVTAHFTADYLWVDGSNSPLSECLIERSLALKAAMTLKVVAAEIKEVLMSLARATLRDGTARKLGRI